MFHATLGDFLGYPFSILVLAVVYVKSHQNPTTVDGGETQTCKHDSAADVKPFR